MTTWIVGTLVAGIMALAVIKVIRDRKRGNACGSCEGCDKCNRAE